MDDGLTIADQIRNVAWPPDGFLLFFITPVPDIGVGPIGLLQRKPEEN